MLKHGAELPLFPLNTVLFPGMMLPLHIFEERYKLMIRQCMAGEHTFGVILAKSQRAQMPNVINIFPDDLFSVGTTAFITAVEEVGEGKLNIITVGQERFVINTIRPGQDDYLIAKVDPLPLMEEVSPPEITMMVRSWNRWSSNILNTLAMPPVRICPGQSCPLT
jgi:Lon protease-like protein